MFIKPFLRIDYFFDWSDCMCSFLSILNIRFLFGKHVFLGHNLMHAIQDGLDTFTLNHFRLQFFSFNSWMYKSLSSKFVFFTSVPLFVIINFLSSFRWLCRFHPQLYSTICSNLTVNDVQPLAPAPPPFTFKSFAFLIKLALSLLISYFFNVFLCHFIRSIGLILCLCSLIGQFFVFRISVLGSFLSLGILSYILFLRFFLTSFSGSSLGWLLFDYFCLALFHSSFFCALLVCSLFFTQVLASGFPSSHYSRFSV